MTTAETDLTCECGSFHATLREIDPKRGTHLRCHCADCRAAYRILRPNVEPRGGIHIYQTDPDKIDIIKGQEHFECLQLSPKGMLRWYASCCDTPLINTTRSAKMPFAGVLTATANDPHVFGAVIAEANIKGTDGKVQHKGMTRMVIRLFSRMISTRISGRWKETPFFSAPLFVPIFEPRLVAKKDKRDAYKR